jgi:hypothetical protein
VAECAIHTAGVAYIWLRTGYRETRNEDYDDRRVWIR